MSFSNGILTLPSAQEGLGVGSAEVALPGSGLSQPGGVESVFEYRGLYLNIRSWIDTYLITNITGLDDADVRDAREVNPGYDGETYFDAHYGGRTIVLTGRIRAHSLHKMRDMIHALRLAFAPINKEYPLAIRTGDTARDTIIYCKKSSKLDIPEAQENFKFERPFQVTLRSSDSRMFSYLQTQTQHTLTNSLTFPIINKGNYMASTEVHITGPANNVNIVSYHGSHSHEVTINTNIPSGETWVLNSKNHTFKNLADGSNKFVYLDDESDWIELHPYPETNVLEITASGVDSGSVVTVYHRDSYL